MLFVKGIIENTLIITNKPKDEVINLLENKKFFKDNDSFNYLIYMPIFSLTKEKIIELSKQYKDKEITFFELERTDIKDIWLTDLNALENAL